MVRTGTGASAPRKEGGHIATECLMDFANFTERARSALQAAQMEDLAGRHQNLLPEHLLKALLEDPEGLAVGILRDAGGDPDLLKSAAAERLSRLPKVTEDGTHPIFMSPELAAVFQTASEAGRAAGDRLVPAERLLASPAAPRGGRFRRRRGAVGVPRGRGSAPGPSPRPGGKPRRSRRGRRTHAQGP